jgi:hypothetical protein
MRLELWWAFSPLHVALGAIAFGLERCTTRAMAGSARNLVHFGRLVQTRFVIQRRSRAFLEQLIVTRRAVALGAFDMVGVIKRDVSVLRHEYEFLGRGLFLREDTQSYQGHGQQTIHKSAHNKECSNFGAIGGKLASFMRAGCY